MTLWAFNTVHLCCFGMTVLLHVGKIVCICSAFVLNTSVFFNSRKRIGNSFSVSGFLWQINVADVKKIMFFNISVNAGRTDAKFVMLGNMIEGLFLLLHIDSEYIADSHKCVIIHIRFLAAGNEQFFIACLCFFGL